MLVHDATESSAVAATRRLRAFVFGAAAALCIVPASMARAQALDDEALLAAIITTLVVHDVGIPVGLLPLPATQLIGEAAQFSANLALKGFRPWLQAPATVRVFPLDDLDGDGCSYQFNLPNNTANYDNLFGVPIRPRYRDAVNNASFSWAERWGTLGPPNIYHGNSTARLNVFSKTALRRFDETTGQFVQFEIPFTDPVEMTEYYFPILDAYDPAPSPPKVLGRLQPLKVDRDGQLKQDGPQQVYFPIGSHAVEWTAATQFNTVTDLIVPALFLAFAIHSEAKTAKGGLKVAKKVKAEGIDPKQAKTAGGSKADEATAVSGEKKFDSIWEALLTRQNQDRPIVKQFGVEVAKKFRDEALNVLDKVASAGITLVEEDTGAFLQSRGELTDRERKWIDMIYKTAVKSRIETTIEAIKFVAQGSDANSNKFIVNIIVALLQTFGLDQFVTFDTGSSAVTQQFIVWDNVPPTFNPLAPKTIEATDFGGTRRYRKIDELRAAATAASSDNCGRVPDLRDDTPSFLPLGETIVTWTATDKGPNPNDGQVYELTQTQTITVEDTQPPLLLAPPSKVIEAGADLTDVEADIGDAVAVDLADVQPVVANDAPGAFPLDRRTTVQWTATDASGNAAQASQLITVKTTGTNTQPIANDNAATTLTAKTVNIRLTATDVDELDGVADPLWFKIEEYPAEGEFVAPLLPFFIEDYRTRPGDGLGEAYDPVAEALIPRELDDYVNDNFCEMGLDAPKNFVHEPLFVQVTDAGIRYVLDSFFECPQFNEFVVSKRRFSKWTAGGEFMGQMRIGANQGEDLPVGDTFILDRDGFLYYNTILSPSNSSNELFVQKCRTDFMDFNGNPDTDTGTECIDGQKFTGSSAGGAVNEREFSYARVDSTRNIIYLADDRSIFAFEKLEDGGSLYLGELGPKVGDNVIEDWFSTTPALEVGADGSLYIADETYHRIHKIAGVTIDAAGEITLGDYVGWAGRCTGSGNKACNDATETSRGYSCTFEPDSCTPTLAELAGSTDDARGAGQGQFNTPKYITIDPNDVLYIADYENARVQRLSPDGSFAGEAVSDGTGINKGDRPSFVLGNFGMPESVSVNSSQFYVVDREEDFVHVFGTLPFKEVTDNAATVTYVSDQDFPNPNVSGVDTFTYTVSDGLDVSAPATVSVTVNRNFRPPVALTRILETLEDTSLDLTLPADDPDGIKGKDFLGLDTLTYTITSQPRNGSLSGTDADRVYTPDPDFYGEDTLSFKVNDGRDDSDVATVTINVTPVNDPPVLTIDEPERVALGFPTLFTATFTDDPSDGYEAVTSWGDDQVSTTGDFGEDADGNPTIDGVVVSAPPMPGLDGRTFAEHVFETTGPHTVQVCVTDSEMLPGCDSVDILVEPLVNLGIGGSVYAEALAEDEITQQQIDDDDDFTYEIMVVNEKPSVGAGLTALAVELDATLPGGLEYGAIEIDRGSCTRDGTALACELGDMEPGGEAVLTIEALAPGDLIYDADFDIDTTLRTLTASTAAETSTLAALPQAELPRALQDELEFKLSVELLADTTDGDADGMSDAYEQTFGLDLEQDDSGGDLDGDGLSNLREFELGTSPLDTDSDGDGLSDSAEDMTTGTDPASADTDEDGMPDGWELDNGFDPLLAADGNEDADADGRTNADEFAQGSDPFSDDVAPELTIPADIRINATGVLTEVDIGIATATDGKDGELEPSADNSSPFPTGANVVNWSVTDTAGNTARATQRVDVLPIVNFAIDQTVPEKFPVQVVAELNGSAVEYPVVIPYTVSGTATNPEDHDAADGAITIETGIRGVLDIDIVRDREFEPDETLTLTMGTPVNAAPGVKTSQTITISEPNVGPIVTITAWQQGQAVTTVTTGGGPVFVAADIVDLVDDSHVFDWSGSDAAVTDPADVDDDSFQFDPAGLAEGIYRLRIVVTDDGTPVGISDIDTLLRVVADSAAGVADADGDRVPDDVDDIPNSNILRIEDNGRLLETETGLTLRLGETVFRDGSVFAGGAEADFGEEADFGFPNGVVDFEVAGLVPASSANIVVPLARRIPNTAFYRKFVDGLWRDFVVDADNIVASAPGANGACPPPGSDQYEAGLGVGFGCIQLTIEDGGPNDADQLANGVIRDPGGLAVPVSVTLEIISVPDRTVRGDSEAVVLRARLLSESGDAELSSLTLEAAGAGDDRQIERVRLLVDTDGNGTVDPNDVEIGAGRYDRDNGTLELTMQTPYPVQVGGTDLLVIYDF